jgi:hypothetical protein
MRPGIVLGLVALAPGAVPENALAIRNGVPADSVRYASVGEILPTNTHARCTVTRISRDAFLTAGKCLVDRSPGAQYDCCIDSTRCARVTAFLLHPQFVRGSSFNPAFDVALAFLDSTQTKTWTDVPCALVGVATVPVGAVGVAVGFGENMTGGQQGVRLSGVLQVTGRLDGYYGDGSTAPGAFLLSVPGDSSNQMICAGDMGGPLYVDGTVAAIASFNDDHCDSATTAHHVAVDRSDIASWISQPRFPWFALPCELDSTGVLNTFTITASATCGGTITPSGSVVVSCGASQSFTITADPGYELVDVTRDGIPLGPVTSFTFPMVLADYSLSAIFQPLPCVAPDASLAGWWPGNGTPTDGTGNNNGTPVGSAVYLPGMVGQAFYFDGSNAIELPDSPLLEFTSQMTLEAWIRPDDVSSYSQALSKFGSAGHFAYELGLAPGGVLRADVSGDGTTYDVLESASGLLSTGTWFHVATTFNSGTWSLYLDGGLVASKIPSVSSIFAGGTAPLTIGRDPGALQEFHGLIDEPAVYSRALSAAEIQGVYQAGSVGRCGSTAVEVPVVTPAPMYEGLELAAWPNPTLRSVSVEFRLAEAANVRLEVYDVRGGRVASIVDGRILGAGVHRATWDGRDASGSRAAAGVYLVRATAAGTAAMRRIVLLD